MSFTRALSVPGQFRAVRFTFAFLVGVAVSVSSFVPIVSVPYAQAASAPSLLKDINTYTYGSDPHTKVAFDGKLWFTACINDEQECGLYYTDGTEEGTEKLSISYEGNEVRGYSASDVYVFNNLLYFTANIGATGRELWVTDGTEEGTELLADIYEGDEGAGIRGLTGFGDYVYFTAYTGDAVELWKTQGTPATTVSVAATDAYDDDLTTMGFVVGDELLFFLGTSDISAHSLHSPGNGLKLYRLNDTEDALELIDDFAYTGSSDYLSVEEIFSFDGQLYTVQFREEGEGGTGEGFFLYRLDEGDGSLSFSLVTKIATQSCYAGGYDASCDNPKPDLFGEVNGLLVFLSGDDGGLDIWISDGTTEGTEKLQETNQADTSFKMFLGIDTSGPNDTAFFVLKEGGETDVWMTDGTSEGTGSFTLDEEGYFYDGEGSAVVFGGVPYFNFCFGAGDGADCELSRVNSAKDGIELVKEINEEGSSYPSSFLAFGGVLYFAANDGVFGAELWKTDGTEEGTVLVKDIDTLSESSSDSGDIEAVALNDIVLFVAENDLGAELWKTDGTEEGTVLVKDIRPGSEGSSPYNLVQVGDSVYFRAYTDGYGDELWVTDGTEEGTELVIDMAEASDSSSYYPMFAAGDWLYWKSNYQDGYRFYQLQEGGEPELMDTEITDFSFIRTFNGNAYLSYSTDSYSLYRTNGGGAPVLIAEGLEDVGGAVFAGITGALVYADDGESEGVWKIGTDDSFTFMAGMGGYAKAVIAGNVGYFFYDAGDSMELHRVPMSGTPSVIDMPEYSYPGNSLVGFNGKVYFTFDTDEHGSELWVSDGTEEGTHLVKDIFPGDEGSYIEHLSVIGDTLYFSAYAEDYDSELWISDGTEEGTILKGNINTTTYLYEDDGNEYENGSNPFGFTVFGTKLFFYANDGVWGYEPWVVTGITLVEEDDGDEEPEPEPEPEEEDEDPAPSRPRGSTAVRLPVMSTVPATEAAVVAQLRTQLAQLQAQLQALLSGSSMPTSSVSPAIVAGEAMPGGVRDLDVSFEGADVRALQALLMAQGYVIPAGVTGFFAGQTQAALAAYQAANGITPAAGYFGIKTRNQMKAAGLSGLWW